MMKIFWTGIVACLLIGVLCFGPKILAKPSEIKAALSEKRAQVEEKIVELNREALKKKLAMKKADEAVKRYFHKKQSDIGSSQLVKIPRVEPNPLPIKKRAPNSKFAFKPLDEEDKELTAEVMGNHPGHNELSRQSVQMAQKKDALSIIENLAFEEKPERPLDLNRLNRIRGLYVKANEILDWK